MCIRDSRQDFDFIQDSVVDALVSMDFMSEAAARNWCEKAVEPYTITFIIAVGAFALLAKLLHPFPCLRVYDRLVVVLANHLLFRGIFYTCLLYTSRVKYHRSHYKRDER